MELGGGAFPTNFLLFICIEGTPTLIFLFHFCVPALSSQTPNWWEMVACTEPGSVGAFFLIKG